MQLIATHCHFNESGCESGSRWLKNTDSNVPENPPQEIDQKIMNCRCIGRDCFAMGRKYIPSSLVVLSNSPRKTLSKTTP